MVTIVVVILIMVAKVVYCSTYRGRSVCICDTHLDAFIEGHAHPHTHPHPSVYIHIYIYIYIYTHTNIHTHPYTIIHYTPIRHLPIRSHNSYILTHLCQPHTFIVQSTRLFPHPSPGTSSLPHHNYKNVCLQCTDCGNEFIVVFVLYSFHFINFLPW